MVKSIQALIQSINPDLNVGIFLQSVSEIIQSDRSKTPHLNPDDKSFVEMRKVMSINKHCDNKPLIQHLLESNNIQAVVALLKSENAKYINLDAEIILDGNKTTPLSCVMKLLNSSNTSNIDALIELLDLFRQNGSVFGFKDSTLNVFDGLTPPAFFAAKDLSLLQAVLHGVSHKSGDKTKDASFVKELNKYIVQNPSVYLGSVFNTHLKGSIIKWDLIEQSAMTYIINKDDCPTIRGIYTENAEKILNKITELLTKDHNMFFTLSFSKNGAVYQVINQKLQASHKTNLEEIAEKAYISIKEGENPIIMPDSCTLLVGDMLKNLKDKMTADLYLSIHQDTLKHLGKISNINEIKKDAKALLINGANPENITRSIPTQTTILLDEIAKDLTKNPMTFLNMKLATQALDYIAGVLQQDGSSIEALEDKIYQSLTTGLISEITEQDSLTPNAQKAIARISDNLIASIDSTDTKLILNITLDSKVLALIEKDLESKEHSLEELKDNAYAYLQHGGNPGKTPSPYKTEILDRFFEDISANLKLFFSAKMHQDVLDYFAQHYSDALESIKLAATSLLRDGAHTDDTPNAQELLKTIAKDISDNNAKLLYVSLDKSSIEIITALGYLDVRAAMEKATQLLKTGVTPKNSSSSELTSNAKNAITYIAEELARNPASWLTITKLHKDTLAQLESSDLWSCIKQEFGIQKEFTNFLEYIKDAALETITKGQDPSSGQGTYTTNATAILDTLINDLQQHPEKLFAFALNPVTISYLETKNYDIQQEGMNFLKAGKSPLLEDRSLSDYGMEMLKHLVEKLAAESKEVVLGAFHTDTLIEMSKLCTESTPLRKSIENTLDYITDLNTASTHMPSSNSKSSETFDVTSPSMSSGWDFGIGNILYHVGSALGIVSSAQEETPELDPALRYLNSVVDNIENDIIPYIIAVPGTTQRITSEVGLEIIKDEETTELVGEE